MFHFLEFYLDSLTCSVQGVEHTETQTTKRIKLMPKCYICNATLKDYEYLYGDGECNVCASIIHSCVKDIDDIVEKSFMFEDLSEGVKPTYDLDYYENLDLFDEEDEEI